MGRTAYLFPGQGSQEVGMGLPFADAFPSASAVFDQANAALGFDLRGLIAAGPAETLALTENTQPAVLVASLAAWRGAVESGLPPPDFVAGHSLGEYSALVAAGALALEDAVRVVRARGRFMQEAVPVGQGAMAAILGLAADQVAAACTETQAAMAGRVVVPANINGRDQVVIAGHSDAVEAGGARCKAKGAKRILPLKVSAPFHSPLMEPAAPRLAEVLDSVSIKDSAVPVVTNVDAMPETSALRFRELLVTQVTAAVRWVEIVDRLAAEGCDTFIELGPGSVLGGLVKRQLPEARVHSISHPSKLEAVRQALAA